MLVLVEGFLNVAWDVCVQGPFGVVPFKFYLHEEISFPIDSDFVVFFESLDKMVRVCVSHELHAKVIDY